MAAAPSSSASLLNSLSSLSLSSSEPPPPPAATVSATSSSSSIQALKFSQHLITPVIPETSHDLHSLLFPSIAFSNTLFFKRPYNVQVIVGPEESEERFSERMLYTSVSAGGSSRPIRRSANALLARRRSRRRQRPVAKKDDTPRKKVVDDEPDNWDLIDIEVPYCQ